MAPPSWVILSRNASASADLPEGAALSLAPLAAPPRVTAVALHPTVCPLTPDPCARHTVPIVLAADPSGLLLVLTPPPLSERDDGELRTSHGPDGVTASPVPDPRGLILNNNLGVIAAPGGEGGRFMVAEFQHIYGSCEATLICFSSETGEWVKKKVPNPQPRWIWRFSDVVSHGGRLWWVDKLAGLLGFDPSADEPAMGMQYVLPPEADVQDGHACRCGYCSERAFGISRIVQLSNGVFRCVEMSCAGHGAPKVSMHTLADPATSEWTLEYEASFSEIWAAGLPKKAPVLALLHPKNPDVVYFFLEERLFGATISQLLGVNMRAKEVVECETVEPAAGNIFPFELPPAFSAEGEEAVDPFKIPKQPCDSELLEHWLLPRVTEGTPHQCAHEIYFYASPPSVLANDHKPVTADDGSKAWYFFTSLHLKGTKGKRQSRSVDLGDGNLWTWHGEHGAKPVTSAPRGMQKLGYRSMFSYSRKVGEVKERSGWLMLELGLNEQEGKRTVLCKLYKTTYKRKEHDGCARASVRKRRKLPHQIPPRLLPEHISNQPLQLSEHNPSHPPVSLPHNTDQGTQQLAPQHPRDDELLSKYLKVRQASKLVIHEVENLYSLSPAEICAKYPPTVSCDGTSCRYFYTRKYTEVDSGSWTCHYEPPRAVNDTYSVQIGQVQKLNCFEEIEKSDEQLCLNWKILEFSMMDSKAGDTVLAKMTTLRKNKQTGEDSKGRGALKESQQDIGSSAVAQNVNSEASKTCLQKGFTNKSLARNSWK